MPSRPRAGGVCIQELAERIQNADNRVAGRDHGVAITITHCGTRAPPNTAAEECRLKKKAFSNSSRSRADHVAGDYCEKALQLVPNW